MKSELKYRFKVFGPFPVGLLLGKSSKRINPQDIREFWSRVDDKENRPEGRLGEAGGIYVFGLRSDDADPGKPWYVGKAAKQNFREECFTPHKLVHYHDAMELRGNKSNEPIMYFVARCKPKQRGFATIPRKGNEQIESAIDYVETYFITLGVQCNPRLDNVANARLVSSLSIEGMVNNKDSRRTPVRDMRQMFRIGTTLSSPDRSR